MPIAAPADRRFRRARVKPARKRGLLRRHGIRLARGMVVVGVLAYGGYRARDLLMHAPVLRVSRVVVKGNDRLSTGEVLALVDGLRGQSIVTLDLHRWRRTLQTSPWVADAALRRVLPSTVEISVVERQPMGIGRVGHDLYLVDARGMIIDEYGPHYVEFDLPIIDGLEAPPDADGLLVDEARAGLAARLLTAVRVREDLASRISQIDVSNRRDAVVVLEGETALVRLGDQDFVDRLQAYLDLAPTLHERIPAIEYVDLRFDGRVYVRAAGGPTRTVSRAGMPPGDQPRPPRTGAGPG